MPVTGKAIKEVVAVYLGNVGNGGYTIGEAKDGTYTRCDANTVVEALDKMNQKVVKWWTKADLLLNWDGVDIEALEQIPDWISEKKEVLKKNEPVAMDDRAKMVQFFIGKTNACGCECGAWATYAPNVHSSWCKLYKENNPASKLFAKWI